jgi:hypothetical protein
MASPRNLNDFVKDIREAETEPLLGKLTELGRDPLLPSNKIPWLKRNPCLSITAEHCRPTRHSTTLKLFPSSGIFLNGLNKNDGNVGSNCAL